MANTPPRLNNRCNQLRSDSINLHWYHVLWMSWNDEAWGAQPKIIN